MREMSLAGRTGSARGSARVVVAAGALTLAAATMLEAVVGSSGNAPSRPVYSGAVRGPSRCRACAPAALVALVALRAESQGSAAARVAGSVVAMVAVA